MKKLLVLFTALSLSQSLKSQSYIPMVEDSMIVVNGLNGFSGTHPIVYKYLGDTIINLTTYFKVYYCSSLEDSSYSLNANTSYYGAIREVNKKVYFLKSDSVLERKIYDFSLNINDTTSIYYTSNFLNRNVQVTLNNIDSTSWKYMFYGRKVYEHSHNSTSFFNHYYVIQGFGVTEYSSNEIETDYPTRKLCSIKKNNSSHNIPADYSACYWQIKNSFISLNEIGTEDIEIYPNPTINEITIESVDSKIISVSIFDINGKFINQLSDSENKQNIDLKSFDSGVYILKIVTEKGIVTKQFVKQ